jgi:hypothetical protein
MKRVYDYLEIEPFTHDFSNIPQTAKEDDEVYGFSGLHTIRPVLRLLQNFSDKSNVLLAVTERPKSLKIAAFLLFGVYAGAPTLAAEITSVIT